MVEGGTVWRLWTVSVLCRTVNLYETSLLLLHSYMADNDRASWYHGREHPDSCTHGTTPVKSECVPSGLALPLKMISITTVQQKLHMLRKHHAMVMSQVLVPRPSDLKMRLG